jgi:N-acetylglucosaminyldiphosphoundecaprenol N-acetyl-beta-D-mannosaminyltransferase
VAGTYCPPFGFERDDAECRKIAAMVRASGAEILFAGVGTPKQEKWLAKWTDACGARVSLGVGAAFDFAAGTLRRAPTPLQRMGLEWLWRLAREPRRLFGRYVVKDSRFRLLAAAELARARRARRQEAR